jgi:uncharacterized membrane protein YkgB
VRFICQDNLGEATMSEYTQLQAVNSNERQPISSNKSSEGSQNGLTRLAMWVDNRRLAFKIMSAGMIVMLLWAGSYKLTAPGAEGIVPLVSNSPLIWWHFKIFGPYVGSDVIGLTEFTAAILYMVGYLKPKAGIIAGLITTLMFFITSTMVATTPGAIISVPGISGMRYLSSLGLFLFKDVISLGASLYLIGYFGREAMLPGDDKR